MARKLLISIILLLGITFLVGCRTNKGNIDTSVDTDKQVTNTPSPDDTDTPDKTSDSEDKSLLLLAFAGDGENRRFGYIDEEGSDVIEAQYTLASDFHDGRAVVDDHGRKLVIDQDGNTIYEGQYDIEDYHNGLAAIWDYVDGEYLKGYIDIEGNIIISPRYKEASSFDEKDNAYVLLKDGSYGIIDKNGELLESYQLIDGDRNPVELVDGYIIYSQNNTGLLGVMDYKGTLIAEPKYGRIQYLGNDMFAVYEQDEDNYVINYINPAALMNSKGEELSDFIFHDISYFNNSYASATNSNSTYFIDEKGNVAVDLPQFEGRGSLKLIGEDIIKVELDNDLSYVNMDGQLIWENNKTQELSSEVNITSSKYKPNKYVLINYPVIGGLKDTKVQNLINEDLYNHFISHRVDLAEEDFLSVEDRFTAELNGDLLIVEKSGYDYYFGAAHGIPIMEYYHIDINSGEFYGLDDLFTVDSSYEDRLNEIINSKIAEEVASGEGFIDPESFKGIREDQDYYLTKNSLVIYFTPYEIAAFAAGFPEFEIQFNEIDNLINKEGEFWRAFN